VLLSASLAATTSAPGRAAAATSPIQHVVLIYQENHTFDDLLGATCLTRSTPCNGYVGPVRFADGVLATNVPEPDIVPFMLHGGRAQHLALANKWDRVGGCRDAPYACITHVDPTAIPNLAALADQFVVSDETYAHAPTASFTAHMEIGAGAMLGFLSGNNPVPSTTGVKPKAGWGCPSDKDILWKNGAWVPACVPDAVGNGPYRPSPVPYAPTLMQRLEQAGRTWHVYQGTNSSAPLMNQWSVCSYFYWCYSKRWNLNYNSSISDFVADAAVDGGLPSVSILPADVRTSQHNQTSLTAGDNYIGQVVNAVESGPNWNSTAIFIAYDDCGCFYDHMTPPAGMGFRNPVVIVSPWAKPGGVDSTTADQPYSMLKFIQHNFGLTALSNGVSGTYGYANAFDFTQTPTPPVPMTHTAISPAERRQLRKLAPKLANDIS
jgi:phospholipase C